MRLKSARRSTQLCNDCWITRDLYRAGIAQTGKELSMTNKVKNPVRTEPCPGLSKPLLTTKQTISICSALQRDAVKSELSTSFGQPSGI